MHWATARQDAFSIGVLRDNLALTGANYACGMGECGARTVLLDGAPIFSCLTLAVEAQDHEITTVEGLARGGELRPVQDALATMGGVLCTPRMILAATALLNEVAAPTEEQGQRP
ncbi:MAG: hypothetical protein IT336_00560 [Thermomicrobiales bacterium]|nr:hypothetical protein [Thermomicrobiales bacterium]